MQLVGNNAFDAMLAAAAVAGDLAGAVVTLWQNDTQVDRNTVKADLDVATYSGYASEAITWLAPSVSDDGHLEVVGIVGEFRPTGSAIQNDIYGITVELAAPGSELAFCARFDDAPLPMGSTENAIVVTIRWRPETGGLVVTVS